MGLGLLHAFNQAPPRWVRGLSTVLPTPRMRESCISSRGAGIRGASPDVPTPARGAGAGAGPQGAARALPSAEVPVVTAPCSTSGYATGTSGAAAPLARSLGAVE